MIEIKMISKRFFAPRLKVLENSELAEKAEGDEGRDGSESGKSRSRNFLTSRGGRRPSFPKAGDREG